MVVVKDGESLWTISKRTGVSIEAIKQANGLKSDVIWENSKLIIPAPQPTRTPAPTPVPTPPPVVPRERPLAPIVERQPIVERPPLVESQPIVEQRKAPAGPISEKGLQILRQQVLLDRAGFSPGRIDGYDGNYTRLATTLCETWNPAGLRSAIPTTRTVQVPANWRSFVNPNLPGSGKAPDFKALTKKKEVILYYSGLEYVAERYHCSEGLLKKLNPGYDFNRLRAGDSLVVPNVEPFEIETIFQARRNWDLDGGPRQE